MRPVIFVPAQAHLLTAADCGRAQRKSNFIKVNDKIKSARVLNLFSRHEPIAICKSWFLKIKFFFATSKGLNMKNSCGQELIWNDG